MVAFRNDYVSKALKRLVGVSVRRTFQSHFVHFVDSFIIVSFFDQRACMECWASDYTHAVNVHRLSEMYTRHIVSAGFERISRGY